MAPRPKKASKKPRSAALEAPAKQIEIKVDRALAAAWKKTLAVLQSSNLEGMRAWDRKYEAVGEIVAHNPPLYLAGGVSTLEDFVRQYLPGEDSRSVVRNVRVAQYASPDEEAKYGTSKLDAAIDYLEAKHGKPTNGRIPVDFAKLRLDGKDAPLSFATATVEEVRTAARLAARSTTSAKPARRNPIVVALTSKLPKEAKGVTVHFANGHVSLGAIPIASFAKVLRALAATTLPSA